MKNKQTILYTLLGIMFGVVLGMMTINSASAVDINPSAELKGTTCHDEEGKCECGETCEDGKDCECKKCDHAKETSCVETAQVCGL